MNLREEPLHILTLVDKKQIIDQIWDILTFKYNILCDRKNQIMHMDNVHTHKLQTSMAVCYVTYAGHCAAIRFVLMVLAI
jgi:hypothetical protein